MNKLFLFFLLAGSLVLTSCSKDDDVDEIVGVWSSQSSISIEGVVTNTSRDEWVFEEDNTGQFTETNNGDIDESYSFTWSRSGDTYTTVSDDDTETYTIGDLLGTSILLDSGEFIVATKE